LLTLTTSFVFLLGGESQPASAQAVCGNAELEEGEECDDGNTSSGDCCSATCHYELPGSACGDPGDTLCDDPDTCDGAGTCQPNYEPPTTLCRPLVDVCDLPEYCDGVGACPADGFEPPTTMCRPPSGPCDDPEYCTGVSPTCPYDLPRNGLPCPDGNLCNGDEMCVGFVCTPGQPLECDNGLFCDGVETCHALEGCVEGDPPCGDLACSESADICGDPLLPALSPLGRGLTALLLTLAAVAWLARRRLP